jgi:carboxymethylenebutenolidase
VGFCLGGSVSLLTAARRPIGAAVTFYGGGVTQARWELPRLVDEAPNLQAPWLGLYGEEDGGIPVEQVEELRVAAASSGQTTEVVLYPGAGHGFNCDQRESFHPAASADAWARTLAWFDRWLTK